MILAEYAATRKLRQPATPRISHSLQAGYGSPEAASACEYLPGSTPRRRKRWAFSLATRHFWVAARASMGERCRNPGKIPSRGTANTNPWYNKYQAVVPPAASLERERSAPSRVSNTGRVCARKRPIPCENPLPKVKLTEKERPGRLTIGRYCYICSANQPI